MTADGTWIKSSYSGGQGGDCVEVAIRPADRVAVRDSKDQTGPRLQFTRETWGVFTATTKEIVPVKLSKAASFTELSCVCASTYLYL
jgi:hypothetical protein